MNARVAGKSYAELGLPLPARVTEAVAARAAERSPVAGLPRSDAISQDLFKWLVPQATTRWLAAGVAWYTPQRCEQIFRQGLAGDLQSQWEMFDLMEATWPELATCLGQLKDEVLCKELVQVHAFARKGQEPSEEALARADLVQQCVDTMRGRPDRDENDFEDTVRDLLDARAKGISVLELDYEQRELTAPAAEEEGKRILVIAPRCTRWVHPLWYGYPHGPGSGEMKLRPGVGHGDPTKQWWPGDTSVGYGYTWGEDPNWADFPDHKFIIGLCKSRTGHPLGTAMLHTLSFFWASFNFSAEWFLNLGQVWGQGFRWATYDPSMSPPDQAKLQAVLANMGACAYGMFPAGTTFELKELAQTAGDNVNAALMEVANRVCRLLILRQTLTADVGDKGGGSKALGEVHERMEGNVVLACARWAGKYLAPMARAICVLNYGDDRECPWFGPPKDKGESPNDLADTLVKVSQAGLEPTDDAIDDLGDRLTFPVQRKAVPDPEPPGNAMPGKKQDDQAVVDAAARRDAAAHFPTVSAEVLAEAYRGSMAPFRQIILESKSKEECMRRLEAAYADWDPGRLAGELEHALQLAAAAGAVQGTA